MARAKVTADTTGYARWSKDTYAAYAKKYGVDPNPDNPEHYYDFKAAYASGVRAPDSTGHWPSEFKKPGNKRTYINLSTGQASATPFDGATDTRTMKPVKPKKKGAK